MHHDPTPLELAHTHGPAVDAARMELLSPLLGRFGWVVMGLGLAVRAVAPAAVIVGALDLSSVVAVVAVVCPLGGLCCVVANTVLAWRNSDAARAKLRREAFAAGKEDTLQKFGLRPDGRVFPKRSR